MHSITIKRSYILAGKKQNCERCPAAIALAKHFNARRVNVDFDNIQVDRRVWPTPSRLASWMTAFDAYRGNRSKIPTLTFRLR